MKKHFDIFKPAPIRTDFQPVKEKQYRLFLIWRALPPNLKDLEGATVESLGVKSDELNQILGIKTMKEFGQKIGVHPDTLTDWKNTEPPEDMKHLDWRYWAKEFTPEVIYLLLEGIREKKKADSIKLWLQTVDGFVEETAVNSKASDALDAVSELIDLVNNKADASEQPTSKPDNTDQPQES